MKFLYSIVFVMALVFSAGFVYAQDAEVNTDTEATVSAEETTTSEDEEELTTEEETVLDDATELEASEIDSSEDLEGEIILRTEETVVVKKTDGSTVKVASAVYATNRPGAHRRLWAITPIAPVGSVVTSATVSTTEGGVVIVTANGKTTAVSGSVAVSRNGQEANLTDISVDDEVIALYDENGVLLGLEIIEEEGDASTDDEEKDTNVFGIILGILAIVVILRIVMRKKK
jgi:hypothetical protein